MMAEPLADPRSAHPDTTEPIPPGSLDPDDFEGPDPGNSNEEHDEPATGDGAAGFPVGGGRKPAVEANDERG